MYRDKLHQGFFFFFLSRRKFLLFAAVFVQHLNLPPRHFFLEWEKRPPPKWCKKGGGREQHPSSIPPPDPDGFCQVSGGQQGSLGQSTMVWTATLLICSGAGGLAVQPYMATKGKPWVLNWIYTQSHLTVQTTILGRENGGENVLLITSLTLVKGEKMSYLRLPPWCTYFFMYPYEHMIAMECKEVCILGEVKILVLGKLCWAALSDMSYAVYIVHVAVIMVWEKIAGRESERKRER